MAIPKYDRNLFFSAPVGTIMEDESGLPMVKTPEGGWNTGDTAHVYIYAAAQNDPTLASDLSSYVGGRYLERAAVNALNPASRTTYDSALNGTYNSGQGTAGSWAPAPVTNTAFNPSGPTTSTGTGTIAQNPVPTINPISSDATKNTITGTTRATGTTPTAPTAYKPTDYSGVKAPTASTYTGTDYSGVKAPTASTYTGTDYSSVAKPTTENYKPYDYSQVTNQANKAPLSYTSTDYSNVATPENKSYNAYDYSGVIDKASQAPLDYTKTDYSGIKTPTASAYEAYDYSNALGKANQDVLSYDKQDYSKSLGLADRNTQLTAPSNTLNYADVLGQINTAKNTYSDATYQDPNMVGQITNDIVKALDPVTRQQNAQINSQYNASNRAMQDALAAKGLLRSGQFGNQMSTLEQGRNSELANAKASTISSALSQALPFAQLSLAERAQLQGQQSNAANQYADLLNQQTQHQMDVADYNALQNQNQFQNVFGIQNAQTADSQFGANYASNELQRQFENILNSSKADASEQQYGQQFDYNAGQDSFANQLALTNSQSQENQFGANYAATQNQNSYANLLSASNAAAGENQYGQQFNAEQAQNLFANQLELKQSQGQENQFGANYAATQNQNAFNNIAKAGELAAGENQYGQQFNYNAGQDNFANALELARNQTSDNQFGANFNATQAQNIFGNQMDIANAQTADNQFGANFNATQAQNIFGNQMDIANAQTADNQFGANYNALQNQNVFANALNLANAQTADNQFGANLNQSQYATALDELFRRDDLAQQGSQFDATNRTAITNSILNYITGLAGATGQANVPNINMAELLQQLTGASWLNGSSATTNPSSVIGGTTDTTTPGTTTPDTENTPNEDTNAFVPDPADAGMSDLQLWQKYRDRVGEIQTSMANTQKRVHLIGPSNKVYVWEKPDKTPADYNNQGAPIDKNGKILSEKTFEGSLAEFIFKYGGGK